MTHYRLENAPDRLILVDESGVRTSVIDALRAGRVTVEFEQNMRFLDGHYGPLYYLRLSRRLIGDYFCAPLSKAQAEAVARAAGVEIKRYTTPIPDGAPVRKPIVRTLHITVGQFAALPILENLPGTQVHDGFWARRGQEMHSIVIREGEQWVDHSVEFRT